MLQINPNEVIRISRLINDSLDTLNEDILYFKNKYNNTKILENIEIKEIEKQTKKIEANTLFLNNIINELVEATGENIDKLADSNHSLNFFESKLISHYANNINNNANNSKLNNIDLCYSKDDRLTNYCQKKNFIDYADNYFNNFKSEKYGLNKDTVMNDLLAIYDKRGASEAYAVMKALECNAPSNYHEYNFNPTETTKSNSYYDFSNNINNFKTNSEVINVNGYDYEIVEVLPKDCTKTEELAYNFGKANILNTMKTLPNKYLELCSKGDSNVITLTCDKTAMNNNSNWSGYYKPSSFFSKNGNNITIDIHGSFLDNNYYTQDTLIHEMGHKFDDMSKDKSIFDWLFGKTSYTKSSDKWENAYQKYGNVLSSINLGGYTRYPNVSEFFGDATVAYFKNPDDVKSLCPEVYNLMSEMLDGEYGYSYNDKIVQVLSAN